METTLTLGQTIGLLTAVVGPLLAGMSVLFWQLRGSATAQVQLLERALIRTENQADTLLPALRDAIIAGNTTLTLLQRDNEDIKTSVRELQHSVRELERAR